MGAALREEVGDLAPDHVADEFAFCRRTGLGGEDGGAVAEHGDAIREGEDFVEPVRDVDAGDAARAQVAEDGEEHLHFMLGERGGGFVEDEDARVLGQRLDDFDELLFAHAEPPDGRGGIDGDAEAVEQRASVAVHARPVDEPAAGRRGAEEDILGDGHLIDECELLIDDRDPGALGVGDAVKGRGLAVDEEFALVTAVGVQAAQELDQRGFARAVFPAERVDFAGAQVEGDVAQGDDAGEFLGDRSRGEDRGVGHGVRLWGINRGDA